ncbi:RNAse P Rpr2 Rpp21 subunit domain [Cryptosporidium bovis]|uniref:RNAse P Rpr2 Rpp21 subunit domain n=1 Tax=Cryptosporidium bovis TaxID=310047 RepID=UPI00351A3832|nr:RNAse P Rpr2 Rpp21 subunit domain [Cryptosporidium bovis]
MDSRVCGAGQNSVFHRLNFLLQASQLYSFLCPNLSSSYFESANRISKRKLAKIEPESKRLWCKTCSNHLLIGKTCDIFLESALNRNKGKCSCTTKKRKLAGENGVTKDKEDQKSENLCSKKIEPILRLDRTPDSTNLATNILIYCYRCRREKRYLYNQVDNIQNLG